MPYTMHVVSHTHWDREWYLTFQQFRLRLVDLIDNALNLLENDPDFHYFNLDAQTIVLEDYLQIRPHARERLQRHIRSGRLTVGPWYQLNDQFLTSGEATVRSLLVGNRIAQAFGQCMKVGYLPDQFGNLSQMPQILRGFGMDNAIVGRGYQLVEDRKMEFIWRSPDGSEVITSLLALWYNNAQHIPSDSEAAFAFTRRLKEAMAARSHVRHLLFMNGVDHLEAQPDIGRAIQNANAALEREGSEDRLEHSQLERYIRQMIEEVQSGDVTLEVKEGELREDRHGSCLAGTLSSRIYLKQANHHAQITLEQYAERLSAFAQISGAAYPYDTLLYAWKLLMQNHPHDSICGCSIDQVHREMIPRFQQVEQIGEELTQRALDSLTGRDRSRGATDDSLRLYVFNTLNWTRTDPVTVTLEFPLGAPARSNPLRDDSRQLRGFKLTNPQGEEVPFAVTHMESVIQTVLNPHELPLDQWVQRITIEFIAEDVPACGYATYIISPQPAMPRYPDYQPLTEGAGDFELFYDNDPYLEDVGDAGDEYLYRKPLNDTALIVSTTDLSGEWQENPVRIRKTVSLTMPTPSESSVLQRSDRRSDCTIRLTFTRWRDIPRVEYHVEVDNQARDHRLRILWNCQAQEAVAESAFDAISRPLKHPLEDQGALPFHPQQWWLDVRGSFNHEDGGLTIINAGLPEYEVYPSPQISQIAVTLLRCVGQLSGRGDGPGILTPEAQCPGRHAFVLASYDHPGNWKEAQVWRQAHQFNVPLRAVQAPPSDRPIVRSFVEVEPPQMVVTAIKRAEDRNSLIVRFFNITDEPVAEARIGIPGARRARRVNLNEEPQEQWRETGEITMEVGAKKIVTVEFEV